MKQKDEVIKKAMQDMAKSPIVVMPDKTTFTTDEILTNVWARLAFGENRIRKSLSDSDLRFLGLVADMVCDKENFEQELKHRNRLNDILKNMKK